MFKEQAYELAIVLFDFVKRASKEGATAEEVETLPAVAELLMRAFGLLDF